jgi:hypothetical protein
LLPTLALYDAALLAWFEPWLLPDRLRLPMLALTPAPDEAPHSSLVHMLDVVCKRHGTPDSSFYVRGGELEAERLTRDLHEHQWASQPVCLLGTAFAFVTLLDHWAATGVRFELPASSRVMETGGFKGRSRELTRPALYAALADRLGIAPDRIVNEYGMTELSSQFYDPSIVRGAASERKQAPPWTRVLIIDPRTGREAAAGERGLIRVLDLANVWSIMCVQTEDLGVADADGFTVLGRAAGAAVRGCSLTAEDLPLRSSP